MWHHHDSVVKVQKWWRARPTRKNQEYGSIHLAPGGRPRREMDDGGANEMGTDLPPQPRERQTERREYSTRERGCQMRTERPSGRRNAGEEVVNPCAMRGTIPRRSSAVKPVFGMPELSSLQLPER